MIFIDFDNRGGGGSGSGVTTGQVQDMITSALTAEEETLYTDLQNSVDVPLSDNQMTGLTPTDMESNDGSIFKSTNGTYWEGFNKEDKLIQRKGVYNRTVNVPALSAFTDAEEGDVAVVVTSGGTSWIEISPEDFDDICQEDKWVRGATYKVTGDTAETYTANKAMRGAFVTTGETETSVYLGFGFRKNVGYGFEFGNSQSWTEWDGSEQTFTVPVDYDEWQLYMFSSPDEVVTVFQQTAITPSQTQYQRINGQWVEPGTGSGGEKFVELTMAQYTALTAYSQDTTYIITDAPSIDLNTLATKTEVDGKVDKVSGITANASDLKFPKWNDQGIVTGYTTQTYARTLTLNNSGVQFIGGSNISFFAPTSAGTAGQVLQSNGSGAPVWSSFKMWFGTQTQYDAITTKDSSTIYFVKED